MEKIKKRRMLEIIMGVLLCVGALFLSREGVRVVSSRNSEKNPKEVIVIDPGHGGHDPGKVAVNDVLEKDINLEISKKLKVLLEAEGFQVEMTREKDQALNDKAASNKKVSDMKQRIVLIDKHDPVVTISIHQNSYHEEYVKGAQVFYYTNSKEGKKLAESVQTQLRKSLDPENKREAKANNNYYLLKKTSTPIIVVESGFLSNREEAALLTEEKYQEKVAWAIHLGVLKYINSTK